MRGGFGIFFYFLLFDSFYKACGISMNYEEMCTHLFEVILPLFINLYINKVHMKCTAKCAIKKEDYYV